MFLVFPIIRINLNLKHNYWKELLSLNLLTTLNHKKWIFERRDSDERCELLKWWKEIFLFSSKYIFSLKKLKICIFSEYSNFSMSWIIYQVFLGIGDLFLFLHFYCNCFLQGSFNSTGLVVSSKLPRFSDTYTLSVVSADPKSVSAKKPVQLTKSVTQW